MQKHLSPSNECFINRYDRLIDKTQRCGVE